MARAVKNLPASAGDTGDVGLIPGLGRSPGGHGNPLQYSCLENPWTEESAGQESDMTESDLLRRQKSNKEVKSTGRTRNAPNHN